MKTLLSIDAARQNALRVLRLSGHKVDSPSWQGVDPGQPMVEVLDLFLQAKIPNTRFTLGDQTKANLPWAEDHFQERLRGSSNPGETYLNWPYYNARAISNDNQFKATGEFSHTYQERFHPPQKVLIRYPAGGVQDVLHKLKAEPYTRQAFLSVWHPEDQFPEPKRRVPCTIGYWFRVDGVHLNCTYLIRSCDAIRHFSNDLYLTGRLTQHFAESLSLTPGRLSMWIGSFHHFETDHIALRKLCGIETD